MQFMKRLRNMSLRTSALYAAILIIAAAAVFFATGCQNLFKIFSPKTLAELTPETLDGAYIEDDIYYFYTPYLEEEQTKNGRSTGKITGRQYIIDFGDVYYMGLFVHQSDMDSADEMMAACDDYYYGEIDASDIPVYHAKGTVTAMDTEVRGYYLDSADGSPETQAVMLPYYIDMNRIGGSTLTALCLWTALSAAFLLLAIWFLIKALTGGYQKKLKTVLETMGSPEALDNRLEQFFEATEPVCGVRMNQAFILFQKGAESVLIRPDDLIWAYQSTTQHRTYGIPIKKSHAITLRTMEGRTHTLPMKEADVHTLLETLSAHYPGLITGYSQELEQLYKNNRSSFTVHRNEQLSASLYPENTFF